MIRGSFALKASVLGVLSFAALSTAYATPISGTVNTTGVASVNLTSINFLSGTFVPNLFLVSVPTTGSFVGLAGTTGTIANLTNNLTNTGPQPVGVPFTDPSWMVFSSASPLIAFDLNFINAGTDGTAGCSSSAIGALCTPFSFSPFNLQNTSLGTSVAFSLSGNARNVSTGELSPFIGNFTTQISGQTIPQILATINSGGTITNSYSANFIATIPEPGTISLLGAGLIGLGLLQRRRARSKS
jgi:PEP-CTERM motif